MGLLTEVLVKLLEKEEIQVTFPGISFAYSDLIEMQAFQALEKIKAIIENDSLNDFMCIEKIVCVLEEYGSSGGNRHDF